MTILGVQNTIYDIILLQKHVYNTKNDENEVQSR